MSLEGSVALITGAASGIGLATAIRFIKEGASVVLADRDEASLAAALALIASPRASTVLVDVTDEEQVAAMVETTAAHHGRLDIFIANAGIEGKIGEIVDSTVENFDKVMAVNVRGVWLGLKYVIPVMRDGGGGSIVLTSSGAGVMGSPNLAPYNASKHAVIGLMRCAALECAKYNIRVNTVNPGAIETRMMRSIEEGFVPGAGDQFKQQITGATPMGRYGSADEVAAMMLFLAGNESSYCTGGVYMVDGGNST
jgi:NAD(P)-dependent dehydrogenase (short-subunit alcohol dehydrogenase family)